MGGKDSADAEVHQQPSMLKLTSSLGRMRVEKSSVTYIFINFWHEHAVEFTSGGTEFYKLKNT